MGVRMRFRLRPEERGGTDMLDGSWAVHEPPCGIGRSGAVSSIHTLWNRERGDVAQGRHNELVFLLCAPQNVAATVTTAIAVVSTVG